MFVFKIVIKKNFLNFRLKFGFLCYNLDSVVNGYKKIKELKEVDNNV